MPDMLVNLLEITDYHMEVEQLKKEGIEIFRAIAPDKFRIFTKIVSSSLMIEGNASKSASRVSKYNNS